MVVFEVPLPLAGVFDDDLRLVAGLEVVSDSAIGWAAVSSSTVGSEVASLGGSSWTWLLFFVDLAGDLRLVGVFEDDLRLAASFEVVSATSVEGKGVVSDCTITWAAVSCSAVGSEVTPLRDSS